MHLALASIPAIQAQAQTPSLQIGAIDLKPYLLQQFDEGGTFDQSRGGGQATGFNLRRSRFGVQADVAHTVQLGFIWDFGGTPGNHSRLFEADITYSGLAPFVFRAGVFQPDFTLEYAQAAGDTLFLERAAIVNIIGGLVAGPGRVAGQVGATGDRWYAAALLTGGRTGPGAESEQRAVLGRVAGLAVKTADLSLHLGVSGAWLFHPPHPGGRGGALSFSDQPELAIDDATASLATGSIASHGAYVGGLEAGLGWSRLWVQGELYGIDVDRRAGGGTSPLSGYYVQAAYTLAGTPRTWKSSSASWGSPRPQQAFDPRQNAWGALEIGARFSAADLDAAEVHGGRQAVWTAGMNWFPADPLRFTLQYQHTDIRGGAAPRSLSAIALRGQLHF